MGGEIQAKLWPRNDEERQAALDAGYDLNKVLTHDDLVATDNCYFAATGITDGGWNEGTFDRRGCTTESLVMGSRSGTVRLVRATHRIDKVNSFTIDEPSRSVRGRRGGPPAPASADPA